MLIKKKKNYIKSQQDQKINKNPNLDEHQIAHNQRYSHLPLMLKKAIN